MADPNVYLVEKILDRRKRAGKYEYLVKWKEWDEGHNTWEPYQNIIDKTLIHIFRKSEGRRGPTKDSFKKSKFKEDDVPLKRGPKKKDSLKTNEKSIKDDADVIVVEESGDEELSQTKSDVKESEVSSTAAGASAPPSSKTSPETHSVSPSSTPLSPSSSSAKLKEGDKKDGNNKTDASELETTTTSADKSQVGVKTGDDTPKPALDANTSVRTTQAEDKENGKDVERKRKKDQSSKRKTEILSNELEKTNLNIASSSVKSPSPPPTKRSKLQSSVPHEAAKTSISSSSVKSGARRPLGSAVGSIPSKPSTELQIKSTSVSSKSKKTSSSKVPSLHLSDKVKETEVSTPITDQGAEENKDHVCEIDLTESPKKLKDSPCKEDERTPAVQPFSPEYWLTRNPVADQVFITDVKVNLCTVTIRECKTEKSFFKQRGPEQDAVNSKQDDMR